MIDEKYIDFIFIILQVNLEERSTYLGKMKYSQYDREFEIGRIVYFIKQIKFIFKKETV